MSRRKEAIEEFRRSMPGSSCKPVSTILDGRGNASSIKSRPAAPLQDQWPQHSVLPASGISIRGARISVTPHKAYFPNEIFEGAIRRYLFNVYCRKLSPLFL